MKKYNGENKDVSLSEINYVNNKEIIKVQIKSKLTIHNALHGHSPTYVVHSKLKST